MKLKCQLLLLLVFSTGLMSCQTPIRGLDGYSDPIDDASMYRSQNRTFRN